MFPRYTNEGEANKDLCYYLVIGIIQDDSEVCYMGTMDEPKSVAKQIDTHVDNTTKKEESVVRYKYRCKDE